MSRKTSWRPRSLSHCFEAPEGFAGCFGWMCAYSADAAFLDIAAECFLGQTRGRRATSGRLALAVMLDPGNPQITLVDVPGVAHLLLKAEKAWPYRLMHAKVALLCFQEVDGERWLLRLIVSTGNWTRETLESIDLAWSVELSSDDLAVKQEDEVRLCCADIWAAWDLLTWLRGYFDDRALSRSAGGDSENGHALQRFERCCRAVTRPRGEPSRLLDSRRASLLSQLPDRIAAHAGKGARNHLSIGSAYYESGGDPGVVPRVLDDIVKSLRDKNLLTKGAEVRLYVNPDACQAVAACREAVEERQWAICRPVQPPFTGAHPRFMHAKFLFGANTREGSEKCTSTWVYLGSGNFTGPGFGQTSTSTSTRNFEAGVVFAPGPLWWEYDGTDDEASVVGNLLPIARGVGADSPVELQPGGEMPVREQFLAPPIAWVEWHEHDGSCFLEVVEQASPEVELLDTAGTPCDQVAPGRFSWRGERPRIVTVRWADSAGTLRTASVPVVDTYGRFGATALPPLDLDAAWWQLDAFPRQVDDDESEDELKEPDGEQTASGRASRRAAQSRYPVREMMELVESIAAKQTALTEESWPAWCVRLQQTLEQAAASPAVGYFLVLGINPLSPLRHSAFLPDHALAPDSDTRRRYEQALDAVEQTWRVAGLPALGSG